MEANASAGPDTITLPPGVYTLSREGTLEDLAATGDLDITSDITIEGAGEGVTTIDGGEIDRVIDVIGDVRLSVRDATIRGGLPRWIV